MWKDSLYKRKEDPQKWKDVDYPTLLSPLTKFSPLNNEVSGRSQPCELPSLLFKRIYHSIFVTIEFFFCF